MSKLGRYLISAAIGLTLSLALAGSASAGGLRHTVVAGDTLSGISSVYAVAVDALAQLNNIPNPNLIFPGQLLEIPGLAADQEEPSQDRGDTVYEIQPGDTLSAISLRFNVSVAALQSANGLTNADFIVVGQRLVIPSPQPGLLFDMPTVRPSSPEVEAIIDDLSAAEGIDANLVRALAWVESGWRQSAVSPTGALGVMQLMPDTTIWLENDVFHYELNEDASVYDNVKAGVRLLRILLDSTGDVDLALASYYQGQGPTLNGVLYDDTRSYVRTVRALKDRFWP
jgi:LysM repeat protein